MGLPSRILQFARYLARESISIIFEDVVFAGEPLPEHKKEFLRRTIGAKRFSGLYGSAEAGVWAFQSDQMAADLGISADAYLFPKQLMHVEIAAADGDGYGNIVTTNLVRTRHPLLRYDSGDVGRMVLSSKCPRECRLLELRGRTERSFEIGGEYYALDDFVGLFAEAGLLEYQIVLTFDPAKQMDLVSFFLVAGPAAEVKAVKLAITSGIRKIVQSNDASFITEINFVESETLARSKTGQKVLKIVDSRPK
jgi:phenylacetate-coenzyme A ligase PaaK-like adenylate-forming protein